VIIKTHAVLLRTFPYSETSTVAVWLTEDAGKVTTLIKGAQRAKSPFIGHLDLYYTCEILFYERSTRSMHILKECAPLLFRHRLRHDWRACAAASYFAYLLYRVTPDRAHQTGLYAFLNSGLEYLNRHGATVSFLFWFELKLLHLLGLAPRLGTCASCGTTLKPAPSGAVFAVDQGTMQCADCSGERSTHAHPMPPDIHAILSGWQRARTPQLASTARITGTQVAEVSRFLGRFMEYHLELPRRSRGIALDLLGRTAVT